jgi:hypothetical protein
MGDQLQSLALEPIAAEAEASEPRGSLAKQSEELRAVEVSRRLATGQEDSGEALLGQQVSISRCPRKRPSVPAFVQPSRARVAD